MDMRGFSKLLVKLQEGRNKQIRRMFSSIGDQVVCLVSISIGPLKLESVLLSGAPKLSANEVKQLRFFFGNSEYLLSCLTSNTCLH